MKGEAFNLEIFMNLKLVAHHLGFILLFLSVGMLTCSVWAFPSAGGVWEQEKNGVWAIFLSAAITGAVGGMLFRVGRKARKMNLFRREAIAIVGLGWILASLCGTLPYLFSGVPRAVLSDGSVVPLTFIDAFYESVSGFTTTGGSILGELDDAGATPRTILFWRSFTHFIGGVGIMVFLVAILGSGMSGRLLVQREASGPQQSARTARIQMTLRRTLTVYLVLNAVLIVLLRLCGLDLLDSLCHAFGTVATGGLSSRNASFAAFRELPGVNFAAAEWILTLFMFVSGMNFMALYFLAFRDWKPLVKSREWQIYLGIVALGAGLVLFFQRPDDSLVGLSLEDSARNAFFQVVSTITTTGYVATDYSRWTAVAQMTVFSLMFVSACTGSTTGGFKIMRYIILFKTLRLELEKVYRPAIVRPLYLDGERVRDSALVMNVLIFFSLAFLTIVGAWVCAMLWEPDSLWALPDAPFRLETKAQDLLGAVVSHFANVGLGTGIFCTGNNFGVLTQPTKLLFSCLMLLGRLDFYAILLLFSPAFWKK